MAAGLGLCLAQRLLQLSDLTLETLLFSISFFKVVLQKLPHDLLPHDLLSHDPPILTKHKSEAMSLDAQQVKWGIRKELVAVLSCSL